MAWQYYEKAVEILTNLGFIGGNIDPCFYAERSAKGTNFVALYLDNNLVESNIEAIDNTITALKENGLVLKIM